MDLRVDERYIRNIGAISAEEQALLRDARVFVAGCGGLGGYILEHLARAGVGHIVCADAGRFQTSDLNRQLLADAAAIGRDKAACAFERIRRIRPDADVTAVNVYMDAGSLPGLVKGCGLALDATDNAGTRKSLFAACKNENIPLIYAAVNGWRVQAAFLLPEGDPYELLYPGCGPYELPHPGFETGGAQAGPVSVMSFAPGMAASMQAALAVRRLCGKPCRTGLHYFDMLAMEYRFIEL